MVPSFLRELLTGKVNRFILCALLYLVSDQIYLRSRISELEGRLTECDSSYKNILTIRETGQMLIQNNNPINSKIKAL
jgi:hypothetical protein